MRNSDIQEHIAAQDRVLKRCEGQELYLKLSKCKFCVPEIPGLGDFAGRAGVRMDPDKMKIIRGWPVPNTKKPMEYLLGTTVYLSRFYPDFVQFVRPLNKSIKGKKSKETLR
ncbi:hypothetical protein CCR75_000515 [Bremia lactucae]|uniref:Reverse transcriptase n=1 Tax=Bremia lactucae TaxID=4779 RepID=A0A976IJB2_BRELC|nr:hypothetical protein CCR75_000515 [Bremia lactucae]